MKLTLCIFLGISLVLLPTIMGQMWAMWVLVPTTSQMWAIEYRGPLISGMDTPRSPAVELGSSPYKEKGVLKRQGTIHFV